MMSRKQSAPVLVAMGLLFLLMPSQSQAQSISDCMDIRVERLNSSIVEIYGLNKCSEAISLRGYLGGHSNMTNCYQGNPCKYAMVAPKNTKMETKYCIVYKMGPYIGKPDKACVSFDK